MANATLSIGSSGYTLLDALSHNPVANQSDYGLSVSRAGAGPTIIKANPKGATIENLGLSNGSTNSNTSIFGSLTQLEASLGGGNDTLNIYGNVAGSTIQLDENPAYPSSPPFPSSADGNDSLNINGNLLSNAATLNGGDEINRISTGGGNDTIRITGQANDAFIYLGSGNDSLSVTGVASNLDIKAGSGNDAISFSDYSTNVSVATQEGNDTVIFTNQLVGVDKSITFEAWPLAPGDTPNATSDVFSNPSIDLGSGNDSLILGGGTSGPVAINTGSGNDTIQLKGAYESTQFILDGRNESYQFAAFGTLGKDQITASPNSSFTSSSFVSNNNGGDTLAFGNGTQFVDSTIRLSGSYYIVSGNDSVVFGSNSSIVNSEISVGNGADTLVFGANATFYNSTINLGSGDLSADRIIFSSDFNGAGVNITGGGAGDTLYIGATAYAYNTTYNDFYNGSTYWKS